MTDTESNKAEIRYAYPFGEKGITPPPEDRHLLGGKGKGLAEMASIGLPVPPGFIITTEACNEYRRHNKKFPKGLEENVIDALKILEADRGMKLGDSLRPLLVSVRSGARVSMPGMMDTILNLGLNDQTVLSFAEIMNNERLAYDNYRRFIMMYSDIVKGISRKHFEQAFDLLKKQEGVHLDIELSLAGLKQSCHLFKKIYEQHTNHPFIQNVQEQLFSAIAAVFDSWDGERAVLYRELNKIPDDWGTGVIVQGMVFGNRGNNSATGVAFTRDPATGENVFYGEFLQNAQGEEVVAGIRTPHPINKYQKEMTKSKLESLEELMPEAYQELHRIVHILETHYKDTQDIEFTIDDGKLYMLQTRTGKRTGFAAIRIALEMLNEGLIDEKTALKRIQPNQLIQLLAPVFDQADKEKSKDKLVAKGLNAGPGAASGKAAFSKEQAIEYKKNGHHCILVREETNPDDFPGMVAADGILTMRGGSTSHAAVVARGMGKPCVVGCGSLYLNDSNKTLSGVGLTIKEGDSISIDGLTGEVFFCEMPTSPSEVLQVLINHTKKPEDSLIFQEFHKVMELADKYRTMAVRANADNPQDAKIARAFGAEGIGLCRTEHMFMEPERLNDVRCMFFSTHTEERKHAIDRLLPYQKKDFKGIFRNMQGLPVTVRLLDPPLHEFMPHSEEELVNLSQVMGVSLEKLREIGQSLTEHNPMLGHRGCRLGITYPELTEMQTRAILEAALEVAAEGIVVIPEIMVPLVGTWEELEHQRMLIEKTARNVFGQTGMTIHYTIGTMIELPRACLTADEIAKYADFFSFGTNDLTQTAYGISRDDSGKFVPSYIKGVPNPLQSHELKHIFLNDPFEILDTEGVGVLMHMAIEKGRRVHPKLKCGICGEHGGEPHTVVFCQSLGLDYVSCSPYRVPIARLAAAWANLN
jgi:pyruvate,orthophosphate dikinase